MAPYKRLSIIILKGGDGKVKKKSFLKKYMVFGLAVVLTMTVNLPVYAQETEEMTASVVEVQEEWSQQEENENQGNMALYETDPTAVNVASVDGVGYATLKDAVNAADGKVVELLSNVALTEKIVVKGSNVTLDLKGYTITGQLRIHLFLSVLQVMETLQFKILLNREPEKSARIWQRRFW